MSSTGCSATITAVAVFENGRRAEGMSYIFDAQMYLGNSTPLLAALRYFNRDNREFDDMGFYFVTARVAMMEPGAMIARQPNSPTETEYDLVGDVVNLIPIKIPDGVDHSEVVDPKYLPYVELCGIVQTVDDVAGTFHLKPHQYVALLRNSTSGQPATSNSVAPKFCSTLPVKCLIPDTQRWKTKSGRKMTPKSGGYLSVTGFMTDRNGTSQARQGFCLDVDSMVFLGRPIVTRSAGSQDSLATESPSTPGRAGMRFDFTQTRSTKKRRVEDA
ncbi:hypothetical protein EV363DRAFT_1443946 [Boletus edulis]|nr:hypothetical protein EV363DRAFT_1443946 [Boletus edulis]